MVSVQQECEVLYTATEAAKYLNISTEKFMKYTYPKSRICYILQGRTKMYKVSELNRFKRECLDARG
jgi:hypothetical protein